MKIELFGGPHCGLTMQVPAHLTFVRIPVPGGMNTTVPTFADPDIPLSSQIAVAMYQRNGFRGQIATFLYAGQELM